MVHPSEYRCTKCLENKGSTTCLLDIFHAFWCFWFFVQLCVRAECGSVAQAVGGGGYFLVRHGFIWVQAFFVDAKSYFLALIFFFCTKKEFRAKKRFRAKKKIPR